MKNISFMLTPDQILSGIETETRRLGWLTAKPGQRLQGVRKGMGLKAGEKVERLRIIEIVSNDPEPLGRLIDSLDYGVHCIRREGFGDHPLAIPSIIVAGREFRFADEHPDDWAGVWVPWFCASHTGCTVATIVSRLCFLYPDAA